MARVDGALGSLVQGDSQQPARARLPGQSEQQVNLSNDEVFGLTRRAPTAHIASTTEFADTADGAPVIETGKLYDANADRFEYLLRTGTVPLLRLFDGGTERTVTDSSGYLVTSTVATTNDKIIFKNVAGKVLILNTETVPAMLADVPTNQSVDYAHIYSKGGQYFTQYKVTVTDDDGTWSICYVTPDGAVAADANQISPTYIANKLYLLLTNAQASSVDAMPASFAPAEETYWETTGAKAQLSSEYTFELKGHVISMHRTDATAFTLTCTENSGADLLFGLKTETDNASDLPTRAREGTSVTIKGARQAEDDYYLRFTTGQGSALSAFEDLEGVWEECTAPAQKYKLDPATMPHELVKTGSNYTVDPVAWIERSAGDNDSNPHPHFIDEPLSDMADFQERLCVMHGREFSASRTNDEFNFFAQTATTSLDTDPINLRATSTDNDATLQYMVPFNKSLVLFGTNNAQYLISGATGLAPATAAMALTSEFEIDISVRPVPSGDNIYFTSNTGRYTQLHEMFVSGSTELHQRRTVTSHVPRYILGSAKLIATSDAANMVLIVADDLRTAYVYEYLWVDQRRVQSAWSKWTFDTDMIAAQIDNNNLKVFLEHINGSITIEEIQLDKTENQDISTTIHLDGWQTATLSAQTVFQVTTPHAPANIRVVQGADGDYPASKLVTTSVVQDTVTAGAVNTVTITLKKAYTGDVIVGAEYVSRYVPTMPIPKDADGVAVTSARLIIQDFVISYTDTGPFTVKRETDYIDEADWWTLKYTGNTLGDPNFTLGSLPIDTGEFRFPFSEDSRTSQIAIESNEHYPMTFTEIEWNGMMRSKSRRLSNGGR